MTGRGEKLATFRREAKACRTCDDEMLHHREGRRALPLVHEGATCPSGVLIVTEAPNAPDTFDDDKGRLTFDADPTANFQMELLESVGLGPDDVVFTNAVLCLPKKVVKSKKHEVRAAQLRNCTVWLERLISDVEPTVVVTFGATALAALRRLDPHGLVLRDAVGKLHSWRGRQILPLYHPSRLGRVTRKEHQQRRDIVPVSDHLKAQGWSPRAANRARG